jgi:hypothetical protein
MKIRQGQRRSWFACVVCKKVSAILAVGGMIAAGSEHPSKVNR